jgi:Zn-dependent protease
MISPLILLVVFFFLFLMSVVFHELGHAAAALWCGDTTARDRGRITLNPIAHIDPIWSILMPILTTLLINLPFGGAKPVPVDPRNFRRPRRDDLIVTLAGPAANLIQAALYAGVFAFAYGHASADQVAESALGMILVSLVFVNLFLAAFNLVPVPPLDGSHVLCALLPHDVAQAYRSIGVFGILIVLALLQFTGLGVLLVQACALAMSALGIPLDVFGAALRRLFSLASEIGL